MSFLDKAKELADQAKERANDFAEKASPYAERAGEMAAKGLDAAASRIDKQTQGKYHDTIDKVNTRVGNVLRPNGDEKDQGDQK